MIAFRGNSFATVAINLYPPKGPWGGAGIFVQQIGARLKERGIRVQYNLKGKVDLILLMDPRDDLENKAFGMHEIRSCKATNPEVVILHRVNECDARKKTAFMDKALAEANGICDHTVFISEWLRDYHADRWFDLRRPHSCIYNGADDGAFNPLGRVFRSGNERLRLVTHHWSDNVMKGFDWYERVDSLIAAGKLPDTELWVIGRWPKQIEWRAARTFPPCSGKKLAALLKQCDVYFTASRWEPCGMHHVEGAQCGLPLVYHEDGGGIVEAGKLYGIGFTGDFTAAWTEMRKNLSNYQSRVLELMPCGDRMSLQFVNLIQRLICESGM